MPTTSLVFKVWLFFCPIATQEQPFIMHTTQLGCCMIMVDGREIDSEFVEEDIRDVGGPRNQRQGQPLAPIRPTRPRSPMQGKQQVETCRY